MWGPQYQQMSSAQRERITDDWIQRNIRGGLNSPAGQAWDEYLGGNPNPTAGQQILGTGVGLANLGPYPPGLAAVQYVEHRHRQQYAPHTIRYPPTTGYPQPRGSYNPWAGW